MDYIWYSDIYGLYVDISEISMEASWKYLYLTAAQERETSIQELAELMEHGQLTEQLEMSGKIQSMNG